MWFNYVLEATILANVLAQLVKVPLHLLIKKQWKPSLMLSTGGCLVHILLLLRRWQQR